MVEVYWAFAFLYAFYMCMITSFFVFLVVKWYKHSLFLQKPQMQYDF